MSVVDHLSRRRFASTASIAVAAAAFTRPSALLAQPDASPEAGGTSPVDQAGAALVEQVLAVDPAKLLARLQTAPVETTLFPADAGPLDPFPWEDEEEDLRGALGAAAYGILQAAILVFPDEAAAIERLDAIRAEDQNAVSVAPLLGLPGLTSFSMFGPITIIAVGNVHVWGYGTPPPGEPPTSPQDAVLPTSLRSVTNAVAILDHLRITVTGAA